MSSEESLFIRLYLDEDVHESLAHALRQQSYDVMSVREAGQRGRADADQLAYAAQHNRTLFSFNATDDLLGAKRYPCRYYCCQTNAYRYNPATTTSFVEPSKCR